jgi:hypothetical protein
MPALLAHITASSFRRVIYWRPNDASVSVRGYDKHDPVGSKEDSPMARWWTKPPIIIAVLGILAVIITAFLPIAPITQPRSGAGSPAIGSADRDDTTRQQGARLLRQGQSPAARIWTRLKPTSPRSPSPTPPDTPTPLERPLWQEVPVIVAVITGIASLGAAIISRPRATSPHRD